MNGVHGWAHDGAQGRGSMDGAQEGGLEMGIGDGVQRWGSWMGSRGGVHGWGSGMGVMNGVHGWAHGWGSWMELMDGAEGGGPRMGLRMAICSIWNGTETLRGCFPPPAAPASPWWHLHAFRAGGTPIGPPSPHPQCAEPTEAAGAALHCALSPIATQQEGSGLTRCIFSHPPPFPPP